MTPSCEGLPVLRAIRSLACVALLGGLSWTGAGCAEFGSPREARTALLRDAVSWAGFRRAEQRLDAIQPGTPMSETGIAWNIFQLTGPTRESQFVAISDGWISQMSGGAFGAVTGLGRIYGRSAGTVYGRHVFGYHSTPWLRPAYELRLRAEIIDPQEHELLSATEKRDSGRRSLPGSAETIFFKSLRVVEVRRLHFEPPPDLSAEGVELIPISREEFAHELMSVYERDSYELAAGIILEMEPGTDQWELMHRLGARIFVQEPGAPYVIYADGYANYDADQRWSHATADAIYEMWPFGYVEEDRQVFERYVVFRNGGFFGSLPYATRGDIIEQLPR